MLEPNIELALWNSAFLLLLGALVTLYRGDWRAWELIFFAAMTCLPLAAQASIMALGAFGVMLACVFLAAHAAFWMPRS